MYGLPRMYVEGESCQDQLPWEVQPAKAPQVPCSEPALRGLGCCFHTVIDLSLAENSPSRLGWMASEVEATSAQCAQVWTTTPGIFIWFLRCNLASDACTAGTSLTELSPWFITSKCYLEYSWNMAQTAPGKHSTSTGWVCFEQPVCKSPGQMFMLKDTWHDNSLLPTVV